MIAWFIWMPGHSRPEPQIAFDELNRDTELRALRRYPLLEQDERQARLGTRVDELARRYPAPERDSDGA